MAFCRNKLLVSETLKTSAQFAYPMNCVDELRCSTRLGKKYFDIRLTPRCSEQNSPEKYDGWELLWVVSLISQSLCFNRNLYRGNLSACQAPSLIRRSRYFRYPLCAPGLGREDWELCAVGVQTLREEEQGDERSQAFVGQFLGRKSQGEMMTRRYLVI